MTDDGSKADAPPPDSGASGDSAIGVARDPEPSASQRIGRYEILGRLGKGAYGSVHRARDPTIERIVALKLVAVESEDEGGEGRKSSASLFQREVRAAGALHHPHIVTLYDAGRDGDWYYLAMELIEGQTLAKELSLDGRLDIARAVEIGAVVAEALAFAHDRGVVHRDVKPANLMIGEDGHVKVADFGIARIAGAAGHATMTTRGAIVGTPHYMAPEQIRGEAVDGRMDLYALGVVLYEAVTGAKPFSGATLTQLLSQILAAEAKPVRQASADVPAPIAAVIEKAMAKKPEDRFANGRDLAAALRAASPNAPAATARRGVGPFAAAALGAAVIAIGGAVAWQFRGELPLGTAAPAKSGIVEFLSDPPGAEIVVDGRIVGRTPYRKEIAAGSYEIELRKDGYYPEAVTVRVAADGRTPVELEMTPIDEEERG